MKGVDVQALMGRAGRANPLGLFVIVWHFRVFLSRGQRKASPR
jgi:hypothetical protein